MTRQHTVDYYMDGHIAVAFCKICSAEGEKLLGEDCQEPPSTERYKMARYLDLPPDKPEIWPNAILDRLIYIEKKEGFQKLMEEIRKLTVSS